MVVGVLGHTKGGGEERRERRLPFQSVMYRREESKFLFSSLIKAAANPHPFPPCHPAAGSGGRGQLGVSAPFSLSFTSGGGVGAMQPASRRIERTPWAGVSGEPARLCAGSEARYGHPRPPPDLPLSAPALRSGRRPALPGRGPLRVPSPAPLPGYAGMVPVLWVCFEQAPKGRVVRPWGPCKPPGQPGVFGRKSSGRRRPDGGVLRPGAGWERRALAVHMPLAGLWCLVENRL